VYVSFSKIGYRFDEGGHVSWGKIGSELNQTAIKANATSLLKLVLTGEQNLSLGGWTQGTYDIDDAGSVLKGQIDTELTVAGTGAPVAARRNGALNLVVFNLQTGRWESNLIIQDTAAAASGSGVFLRNSGNTGVAAFQGLPNGEHLDVHLTAGALFLGGSWQQSNVNAPPYNFFLSSSTDGCGLRSAPAGAGVVTWANIFTCNRSSFALGSGINFSAPAASPAQITANQNNYTPTASLHQRWSSDASRNVTGLTFAVAQVDGQAHVIINAGSNNIVLVHESASSTAANRFTSSTGADITLSANQAADAVYDGTAQRWRVFKRN
jgi:hypothetical protein